MINVNNLLYAIFSTSQLITIIALAVVLVGMVALNIWLVYLLRKRGEHIMHTVQLQKQREALMQMLSDMHSGKDVDIDGSVNAVIRFGEEEEEEELAAAALVADEGDDDEEDEENETLEVEVTEEGKVVRYNRSFTARIIQSDQDLKARYSELKNVIMSYAGVKARMSWRQETFHLGRRNAVAFRMRGKTLCLFLATDPKMFDGTKYKVEDMSVRNPKEKMPCLFRITSDRKTAYAKELIKIVMTGFGVTQVMNFAPVDYTLPYKSTKALVKRRLIKVVGKIPNIERDDALAAAKRIRYNRSFTARVIQSDDEFKGYYSKLKNFIMAHEDVTNKDSWKKETFSYRRNAFATFVIRGKTLCICLALDPKEFEGTKYKVEDLSLRVKETKTPALYRIKSSRRLNYAIQLLEKLFERNGIGRAEHEYVNYVVPFVATETLVRRGLIKVIDLRAKDYEEMAEVASVQTDGLPIVQE